MKDKIVLIIGAGPGLGSSLAQKFSQSGYHVFASRRERNKKDLQNLQCFPLKKSKCIQLY